MTDNTNPQLPPIQLLITACPTIVDGESQFGWLHGYCLLTYCQVGNAVQLDGRVGIGEPYAENEIILTELAEALDPNAVLAGVDLHDMISRLSRLPIGTSDQEPALGLLAKLKAMLEADGPIDLDLDDEHNNQLALQVLEHHLGFSEPLDHGPDRVPGGMSVSCKLDNGNPHRLAQDLVDTASAAILALGELYLEDAVRPKLLTAWREWRHSLLPTIPLPRPVLTVVSSN